MTMDSWLAAHAYLRPVADLSAEVNRAVAALEILDAPIPDWDDYRADYLSGVPLLTSGAVAVDLEPGERMAEALFAQLASTASPGSPWLAPTPGLLRYAGWMAMARYLAPV